MTIIRNLAKRALWHTGGYSLVSSANPWRGVAVLAYHGLRDAADTRLGTSDELHVRASVLESHLRVLRSLATPISLDDWLGARRHGRPLPPRAVLVTFDDGYRSVREVGVPLLERYDVPAVIFACTGRQRDGALFWFDALERAGRADEIEAAKRLPYPAWRALVDTIRIVAQPHDERAVMTAHEIARCAEHPLLEIGAHTVDHPVLARASVEVQHDQIAHSVNTLSEWTGRRVRSLAYPNGRPGIDFTATTMALAKRLRLECAFSTESRLARVGDECLALPRFTMLDTITDAHLAQYLTLTWPRAS
jgi:peptidoglycan/xylan/chitin deacetylase (PgdA/CDA1 family)